MLHGWQGTEGNLDTQSSQADCQERLRGDKGRPGDERVGTGDKRA